MNVVENICPVCQHKNEVEAVVCENCGSTLDDPFLDPGAKTKTTDMEAVSIDKIVEWTVDEATIPQRGIAMYIEGQLEPAHIDLKDEFVIGRKVDATSDVSFDLSPAGGYHLGISRRHAVIRRTAQGYEVFDLGSVNGTWLNDERLVPHQTYPLTSGSHLRLGRMRLFVRYRPPANGK